MASEGIPSAGQSPRGPATPLYVPASRRAAVPPLLPEGPAAVAPGAMPLPVRPDFAPAHPHVPSATRVMTATPAASSARVWYVAPPRRHPRARVLAGIVVSGLATLLSLSLGWYGLQPPPPTTTPVVPVPTHTAAEREPRARPMPTPTPSRTTAPAVPPIGAALYPLTLAGTCERPRRDSTWAGVQASIRAEAVCLDAMWQPVVTKAGGSWTKPTLRFYSDPIPKTPCGPTPDKEKAPAHYCPGNQTIYISDAVADAVVRYRMLGFEVIAHEYGHHVQELVGILDDSERLGRGDAVTRRIELQAHCVAYVAMVGMDGLEVTTRELDQLKESWRYSGDPEGHGSPEAQIYWGSRGVGATDLGACDTFSVAEDLVT